MFDLSKFVSQLYLAIYGKKIDFVKRSHVIGDDKYQYSELYVYCICIRYKDDHFMIMLITAQKNCQAIHNFYTLP